MKKKTIHRIVSLVSAAALSVGAACLFAGCTSNNPEVTIAYEFLGQKYEVSYKLSRSDAPQTVQHFIELADAGYYDGTCIHNYTANFLCGGGYTIQNGELKEKDYFAVVRQLEASKGISFTQSVFKTDAARTPLYTVVGEFSANYVAPEFGRENYHSRGALVMDYNKMGNFRYNVATVRADGGSGNDGDPYDTKQYNYNGATSLFYTFLGDSNYERDTTYAVFGRTIDFNGQLTPLLNAIAEYKETLESDESFTTSSADFSEKLYLNTLDHLGDSDFEDLQRGYVEPDPAFETPLEKPITILWVRVDKY